MPVILASGQNIPDRIGVDGTSVYFSTLGGSTVAKVAVAGGPVTILASEASGPFTAFVVNSTNVYWTDLSAYVNTVSTGGGRAIKLTAADSGTVSGLAIDDTSLYWSGGYKGMGTVVRMALDGGSATTIASGLATPNLMTRDSTSLYWFDTDSDADIVLSVPIQGGTVQAPVTNPNLDNPCDIAVDGTSIYVANLGDPGGSSGPSFTNGSIVRITPK